MPIGILHPDGSLTDITDDGGGLPPLKDGDQVVPINMMPTRGGSVTYDPINQVVIPQTPTLNQVKQIRYDAIDARTDAIIEAGFTYAGKVFSLSIKAQTKWLGFVIAKDSITYPFTVSAADESSYAIQNAAEVVTIYGTMVGTVSTIIASGKAVKDQVFAAQDTATVDSIIDGR